MAKIKDLIEQQVHQFDDTDYELFLKETQGIKPSGEPSLPINEVGGYCNSCGGFVESGKGYKVFLERPSGTWSVKVHPECQRVRATLYA
jgi:hypothetical protein